MLERLYNRGLLREEFMLARCFIAASIFLSATAAWPPRASAQSGTVASPAFEVVSIRLSSGSPIRLGPGYTRPFPEVRSGRWQDGDTTLAQLVEYAYDLHCCDVAVDPGSPGLAKWIDKTTFAIVATTATRSVPDDQLRAMLRLMLETRFQLKTHTILKSMPVHTLEVARGGPKLRPAGPCDPGGDPADAPGLVPRCGLGGRPAGKPGQFLASFRSFTMAELAKFWETSFFVVDRRPIIDRTGLQGKYDFDLLIDRTGIVGAAAHPDEFRNAVAAAVRALATQDGLRLDAFHTTRMPVPVQVVDHAVMPSN